MFARATTVLTFLFFLLPALAAATALPRTLPPASGCTGTVECCNQLETSDSAIVGLLASLLGIVLGPVSGLVGVNCSPVTVIGTGSTSCAAQPVCCTGNNFSGVLVIGCSPVDITL